MSLRNKCCKQIYQDTVVVHVKSFPDIRYNCHWIDRKFRKKCASSNISGYILN